MKRHLILFLLLFVAASVYGQNGAGFGNGAAPFVPGGVSFNDTIGFNVKLAEDVVENDPAYVTGYTYNGVDVFPAPEVAKPVTTYTPLFAAVSQDGSRLFQVYKTTLGLPFGIWSTEDLGYTTLSSHTTSTNISAYAGYGGFSSSSDNSTVVFGRYNSPYVMVYKWDNDASQYVQLATPFATSPEQQHFNSIAVNHDGLKIAVAANASPYFATYTWDSGTSKYVKDTDSSDALPGKARCLTFIGTSNDILVGGIGYSSDALAKYVWDSGNSVYVKSLVFPGLPGTAVFCHVSCSSDGSRVAARNNDGGTPAYKTYIYNWNSGYELGNDPDVDVGGPDCQTFVSGNGQYMVASHNASPYKVYVYKWNSTALRFERTFILPENTINSKPENISISDSGAQIVFPHYSTIYAYNYSLVGNNLRGRKLAAVNNLAFPASANFSGYFSKGGTAGSVVPFTAFWHKFMPNF